MRVCACVCVHVCVRTHTHVNACVFVCVCGTDAAQHSMLTQKWLNVGTQNFNVLLYITAANMTFLKTVIL